MKKFNVDLKPMLKRLEFVSKKGISGIFSGEFRSAIKGRGLEFNGYRQYTPGVDDAKDIDWKASLRSRYLLVKELVEERNNNVIFLVDVSSTMSFGSTKKLKNEYVIEIFASMAFSLINSGDSIGLGLFSDRLTRLIHPNIGAKHYFILTTEITKPENYEGACDLGAAIHDLNSMMRSRTIFVIISDFIGLQPGWLDELKVMSAKHEVLVFVVNDPRDLELPKDVGQVYVTDPINGDDLLIDTALIKHDFEKSAKAHNENIKQILTRTGVDFLFLRTDEPFSKSIRSFVHRRSSAHM